MDRLGTLYRIGVCTAFVALAISLSGCSTRKAIKQQQLALLTSEYQYMSETNQALTATPNPETQSSMSVFISQDSLNAILKSADNYSADLPGIKGAVLTVHSVRLQFGDGFPGLNIDASAQKASIHASLRLQVYAVLEPSIAGDKIHFRIDVRKVVPEARWTFFQFRLRWFVKDLIQLKLAQYAQALPDLSVPLQQAFSIAGAQQDVPLILKTPSGQIDGIMTVPAYKASIALFVSKVLLLRDGIHIYLVATPNAERGVSSR